jgi:glucose/arabinose dehydrogenase
MLMHVTQRPFQILCFALALALAGCGGGSGGDHPASSLRLEPVGGALGLNAPLFAGAPPGDTARLFVVEKGGVIKIIDLATRQVLPTPFLTVTVNAAGEGGLLGLAFHPNYGSNGFFYVNMINSSGDTEIRRYQVSSDPNVANPASAMLVILIDQPPPTNHKAGWLGFGQDGFLYAALGDGGDGGANAQNLNSLLGKILRLDVNSASPYAIPAGNPFADEIWSLGLRNPFRASFDRATGDLYIADVGETRQEEVNVVSFQTGAGANFGWNTMEGSLCFPPGSTCDPANFRLPVLEYDHSQGCSITGGYVYRGNAIPSLRGTYFYGDFCTGFVRSFRLVKGSATEQIDWFALRPPASAGGISSFGEDASGELYIVTIGGGLFRIVPN